MSPDPRTPVDAELKARVSLLDARRKLLDTLNGLAAMALIVGMVVAIPLVVLAWRAVL